MRRSRITRRTLLSGAAVTLAAPLLGVGIASAKSAADTFEFRGGIGRRSGGPNQSVLSNGFSYPRGNTRDWWQPLSSVDSFSRLDQIFAASTAQASAAPSPWRRAAREPDVQFSNPASLGGGRFDIDGYLDRNAVTGLLIAQGDTILAERYQYDRTDHMRLTSFSMAKTVVALLVGLAVQDGLIASLDDPAERYAPTLAGREYGRTSLRALLTMSSGVKFREDYDGIDDSARLSQATFGRQSAGGAAAVTGFNERIAAPGARWYYASAETFVLALVARQAFRRSLMEVLQERVWQPIGAEADATWLVDKSGLEIGFMGFNAVLRDYARLGVMLANGGSARGRQLVDARWVSAMSTPAFSPSQTGRPFGYGFQTWTLPGLKPTFALFGVRGQYIFIEPKRQLVMVNTAVRTGARDPGNASSFALWGALVSALA
jgi:CubicO group peptidase (beta-lactamase class C family)